MKVIPNFKLFNELIFIGFYLLFAKYCYLGFYYKK